MHAWLYMYNDIRLALELCYLLLDAHGWQTHQPTALRFQLQLS